jgi:hypothetical protein
VNALDWLEGTTEFRVVPALDGGEWSASRTDRFSPGESTSGTHWIGGCVDSRADLDAVENRYIFSPAGNRTQAVQPVASRYAESWVSELIVNYIICLQRGGIL